MKIMQVKSDNTYFKAKPKDYVTKQILKSRKKHKDIPLNIDTVILETVASVKTTEVMIKKVLQDKGLTYCNVVDNTVHVAAGYNGGYYSVNFDTKLSPTLLKIYFTQILQEGNDVKLGGLFKYKSMVADLKRQDIIQKGMRLHAYEMNNNVLKDQADMAAKCLSEM